MSVELGGLVGARVCSARRTDSLARSRHQLLTRHQLRRGPSQRECVGSTSRLAAWRGSHVERPHRSRAACGRTGRSRSGVGSADGVRAASSPTADGVWGANSSATNSTRGSGIASQRASMPRLWAWLHPDNQKYRSGAILPLRIMQPEHGECCMRRALGRTADLFSDRSQRWCTAIAAL